MGPTNDCSASTGCMGRSRPAAICAITYAPTEPRIVVTRSRAASSASGLSELTSKIRELLKGSVAPSFLKVPFIKINGVLKAALTDEHFLRPSDYFLGIRTKEDPRSLAQLVEDADRFKLMPESMAGRAIRGVILKEERFPPLELPAQSNLYYFRLLRGESARSWQQIQTEKSAVVRWTGNESADYDLVLYMTLPKSET